MAKVTWQILPPPMDEGQSMTKSLNPITSIIFKDSHNSERRGFQGYCRPRRRLRSWTIRGFSTSRSASMCFGASYLLKLILRYAATEGRNYRLRLTKTRLAQFQLKWVRQRRDWKIDTGGKESPEDDMKTDLESALSRIMPERGRLAKIMISDQPATQQERKNSVADLCLLISPYTPYIGLFEAVRIDDVLQRTLTSNLLSFLYG